MSKDIWKALFQNSISAIPKKMDFKCHPKFVDCALEKSSSIYIYIWVCLHIYEELFRKAQSLELALTLGNPFLWNDPYRVLEKSSSYVPNSTECSRGIMVIYSTSASHEQGFLIFKLCKMFLSIDIESLVTSQLTHLQYVSLSDVLGKHMYVPYYVQDGKDSND